MIRVLLVDDHASFRQALAFMLAREPDIVVAAQAGTLADARDLLTAVDIAIVDLDLPDGDGVDLIRDLRKANPRGMVLVLSASGERIDLARSVEAGASGVMHKSRPIADVVDALRRLHAGEHLLSPDETIHLLRLLGQQRERDRDAQSALARLTVREREVMESLAHGLSDREIGERLHVSTETVRTHMVNLLDKLGVDSRLQALVFAVRYGAVKIG